jgi:hypothetical protein
MRAEQQESSASPYAAPRAALADPPSLGPSPAERRWFFRSFWISFGLGGLTMILLFGGHDPWVFLGAFFGTFAAAIVFLACLGRVAVRMHLNPISWVLGALLLPPFSYFVAFARMSTEIGLEEGVTEAAELKVE